MPQTGLRPDPRWFQIAALSALLAFGLARHAFEIAYIDIAVIFLSAIFTQWALSAIFAIRFEPKSALITSLSLSLLLRADGLLPLALAAFIAIASKFLIRTHDKHVFNPANIGIVAAVLLTGAAWTTPGQWGTAVWFAAIIAGAGSFVTHRSSRLDVPLVFLSIYAALIFARAFWLGDPLSIPLLRMQNGALILFAFFMISDPKTTPDGFWPRILFVAAAAIFSYALTYHFYVADGPFYALAALCAARPLIDQFDKTKPYRWSDPPKLGPSAQRPPAPAE